MAGRNVDGKIALAFGLGLLAGVLLKGGARELYERARRGRWQRDYERTVNFDQNLPDQLGRREPVPHAAEPRFGGTGALGVSPVAAGTPETAE